MNIKNRIRKIESNLNLDADICRCSKEIIIKVEPPSENGEAKPSELCETCGKEVRILNFTFNFTGDIRAIEPTTNFTREEFEECQSRTISEPVTYEEYLEKQNVV